MLAAMDAMTTGEALMLRAWTVGSALAGRFARAIASLIAAVVSFTFVPYENWLTTSEIELDDVDRSSSSRGTPLMAFSIGLVICSATSDDPAPGYGRHDRDDREVDVRQELLLEASPRRESGDEQGRSEEERDAPLADGDPAESAHGWVSPWWMVEVERSSVAAAAAVERPPEDLERARR